ncbi:MAG: TetR/AcrR family transcriptional regulator [Planctomycetota bacterium]
MQVAESVESVLIAGQKLFLANGYAGTSIEAIAAAAGVGKMTVYRHFKDKETLFVAIVRRECDRITDSGKFVAASTLEEANQALREFATSLLKFITAPENVALLRMMMGETSRFPEMGRQFYWSGPAKGLAAIERILSNLVPKDELWLRAQAFLHTIQGDTFQQLLFSALAPDVRHRLFAQQIDFASRMALSGLESPSSTKTAKTANTRVTKSR